MPSCVLNDIAVVKGVAAFGAELARSRVAAVGKALADGHGFTNTAYFVDDDYSGTNFDRPDWQRLLGMIGEGRIGTIIVRDMSRLGRDYTKPSLPIHYNVIVYDNDCQGVRLSFQVPRFLFGRFFTLIGFTADGLVLTLIHIEQGVEFVQPVGLGFKYGHPLSCDYPLGAEICGQNRYAGAECGGQGGSSQKEQLSAGLSLGGRDAEDV